MWLNSLRTLYDSYDTEKEGKSGALDKMNELVGYMNFVKENIPLTENDYARVALIVNRIWGANISSQNPLENSSYGNQVKIGKGGTINNKEILILSDLDPFIKRAADTSGRPRNCSFWRSVKKHDYRQRRRRRT